MFCLLCHILFSHFASFHFFSLFFTSFRPLILLFLLFLLPFRPPIFVSIFKIGGAITVLGQHLINLKCMFPDMTDGDVFFRIQLLWGVAPPILLLLCTTTWFLLNQCKTITDLERKIKTSCVALLYLLWPSLCSQTFSLFACRSVCDDATTFLRADLDVSCWEGRHLHYALGLGLPMLLLYDIGLPVAALLRVRSMHQADVVDEEDEKIYGMFYTAFRDEMWWWEGTVAARKIVIALIGVFGAEMASMQVHLTAMLVVLIIVVTAQVRPFGGLKHGVLHILEMASLLATFLTLWAGSIFNAHPKCEDPLKGEGSTLVWCDALSVMVGLVDISVLAAIGSCFVYMKVAAMSTEAAKDELAAGVGAVELVEFVEQPTTVDDVYSAEGEEKEETEFTNPMEPPHRRHQTEEGEVYYENMKTGETTWDMPPGFVEDMEETSESGLDIVCEDDDNNE